MPVNLNIKLDRRFLSQAKGSIEKYSFDVGILKDGPHKEPLGKRKGGGVKEFAGGPSRKVGSKSYESISEVSKDLRKRTGINFFTAPFRSKKNKDILAFTKSFFQLAGGHGSSIRRCENLFQAIVRNPILRGDYGRNSRATVKAKGFNRFMIDTAQLFKAITAKVTVKKSV